MKQREGCLENKVAELEMKKTTAEGKSKHYETQVVALENQKVALWFH